MVDTIMPLFLSLLLIGMCAIYLPTEQTPEGENRLLVTVLQKPPHNPSNPMILFCSGTVNAFTFLPKLFLTEDHESL